MTSPNGRLRQVSPGLTAYDSRPPDLGPDDRDIDPDLDREVTTAFDWLGDPPELWHKFDKIIERPDPEYHRRLKAMLQRDGRASATELALTLPLRGATPRIASPQEGKKREEEDQAEEASKPKDARPENPDPNSDPGPGRDPAKPTLSADGDPDRTDPSAEPAQWLEHILFDPIEGGGMETPIRDFLGQVSFAEVCRRVFFEKVWTKGEGGKTVLKKLAHRPPESCEIWRDLKTGEILGFRQYQYRLDGKNPPGSVDGDMFATVKRENAFVFTHGKHRDPLHGVGALDVALWAHETKMRIVRLWDAFLDGQATSRTVVYGRDVEEIKKRAKAMSTLRSGGVAGFIRQSSDENVFDTIPTDGTGAAFVEMIRWLDNVANESVMAGHLGLTGGATEGKGSLALSKDASGLFLASRNAVAAEISDAITADIIAPLIYMNFGPKIPVPRFGLESLDTSKMDLVLTLFGELATATGGPLPGEFVLLLMELVAQHLDLPSDKVKAMMDEAEKSIKEGRDRAAEMEEAGLDGGAAEVGLKTAAAEKVMKETKVMGPGAKKPAGPPR